MENIEVICNGESRFLGVQESIFHAYHNNTEPLGINFGINVISSIVELKEDMLKDALHILCKRHNLLTSHIVEDQNGDLMFKCFNELILATKEWLPIEVLEIKVQSDWVKHIPNITEKGFAEGEPLWKLLLFKVVADTANENCFTYVLVFASHHSIMDGKCLFDVMCNQFLPILNNLLANKDVDTPKPINFPKSFESIFYDVHDPLSLTPVKWYVKAIIKLILWKHKMFGQKAAENKLTLRVCDEYRNEKSKHIHPVLLSEDLTQAFIRVCKQQKITVNSVLTSIYITAIKELESENGKPDVTSVSCFTAMDCRKFHSELCTSPMPLGCFFSTIPSHLPTASDSSKEALYENAKEVAEIIHKHNNVEAFNKEFHLGFSTVMLPSVDIEFSEILHAFNLVDVVAISNLGVCIDLHTEKKFVEIKEHYMLSDNVPTNLLLSVSTFNKKMTFCFSANQHWLDLHYIELLGEKMIKLIEKLVSTAC